MVSNFGISTCNGSGYTRVNRGRGTMRKIAGNVLGSLGHMLINRVANAISGSGRKRRTYKKRTTRVVRGSSYRPVGTGTGRRTYRRKTIGTTRKHRKVGGYKKRVGRPRTRKTRRISTVRRRRILII